jgi:RNA polymerase sigma factor (sigma-70 family)
VSAEPAGDVGHLLRAAAPRVLGALARRHRDFGAAEDAVQEALLAAATQWPVQGVPDNPDGWLYRVAVRRLTDQLRAELARARREATVVHLLPDDERCAAPADTELEAEQDDSLALLFLCCHPALTPASAIALTLRAVGGLSTAEIARAFLVPETTMAQRVSRAKQTIKASKLGFEMPAGAAWAARVRSVLQVLYLIFNEGYTASFGATLARTDLSDEAIRLARMLRARLPEDAEVAGLLALMLLTDARRAARSGPAGELVPLDEQDRSRWDRERIAEGTALVDAAMARGAVGPYQVQAAIAALHDEAPSTEATDWRQIRALYELLLRMEDNPMVALNHTVALAMVEGPAAGLARLDELGRDPRLADHYRLDAVRAHLLERAGDAVAAIERYRAAAARTQSLPERDYLLQKAARLAARPERSGPGTERGQLTSGDSSLE